MAAEVGEGIALDGSSAIPIQNIYYLLSYAWDVLDQAELVDVTRIPATDMPELFAMVLCSGLRHLAKRGLEQGYRAERAAIAGIRGRVDFTASLSALLFPQGKAHCQFDELTSDTPANRVIKRTLINLDKLPALDSEIRKQVRIAIRGLQRISDVRLSDQSFAAARPTSNRRLYAFLLSICEVLYESMFVDEAAGTTRFRDFTRDKKRMAKLFQNFLFNFIEKECPHWEVRSENIAWAAQSDTDPSLKKLPRMQTDISLRSAQRYLIVDAKFYEQSMSTYFETEKIYNDNLYQLLSYLANAKAKCGTSPDGMLIYPKVDVELRERYQILGFNISVCTLDLSRHWSYVHREICELLN